MTPPRALWRVEWNVARHPVAPYDRTFQSRNFTTPERAAEQVASVRMIEPKFAELLGVWRSTGWSGELEWSAVDPESLPLTPQAEYRYSVIASTESHKERMA